MRILTLLFLSIASCAFAVSPEEAQKRLESGNLRYTRDQFVCPDRTQVRRMAVSSTQQPFAIIVGCSDSRVPPEIIFDQGIGDLFVVRVAGNVVGPVELDSIDYAALYLGASLIVVLGHENCGAVDAVLNNKTKDIETIAKMIQPAIKDDHILSTAIKDNVKQFVDQLKTSRVVEKLHQDGKVNVIGGYYNLQSGKVDFFE